MAKLNMIAANAIVGGVLGSTLGALTADDGDRFGGFVKGAVLGAGAGAALGGAWKFADPKLVNNKLIINVPIRGGGIARISANEAWDRLRRNLGSATHEVIAGLFS